MPSTTSSANMLLPIPVVGTDPGPQYGTDINSCLTIIDGHNHTPGSGVPIPVAGLDINADLPIGNNNITAVKSLRFQSQGSPLVGASDLGCLFESGDDLFYNDGAGNQIQITQNGAIAGTPGSISNLVSPASASYVSLSATFVWQSNTLTPANMDAASYILRNLSASSKGLTLSPPAAMAADYTITLPALPVSGTKFVQMDSSGTQIATLDVDASTLVIASQVLKVPASGITATQLATDAVTTIKIQDGAVTAAKLASGVAAALQRVNFNTAGAHSWTAPADVSAVIVSARAGSGGGGSGCKASSSGNARGGGGGGGSTTFTTSIVVTPGVTYSLTVGAKGTGGAGVNSNGSGNVGGDGSNTTFDSLLTIRGGRGGAAGTNGGGLSAGGQGSMSDGGTGGDTATASTGGHQSQYAAGGSNGGGTLDGSGGGGGAGDGAGGDAGTGSPGNAGANGTSGGGGGGGGAQVTAGFSGAGGDGTDGSITVSYVSGSP